MSEQAPNPTPVDALQQAGVLDQLGRAHNPSGQFVSSEQAQAILANGEQILDGLGPDGSRDLAAEKKDQDASREARAEAVRVKSEQARQKQLDREAALDSVSAFMETPGSEFAAGPDIRKGTGLTTTKMMELGFKNFDDMKLKAAERKAELEAKAVSDARHQELVEKSNAWTAERDAHRARRDEGSARVESIEYRQKLMNGGEIGLARRPGVAEQVHVEAVAQAADEGLSVGHLQPSEGLVVPRNLQAEQRQAELVAALKGFDRDVSNAQGRARQEATALSVEDAMEDPEYVSHQRKQRLAQIATTPGLIETFYEPEVIEHFDKLNAVIDAEAAKAARAALSATNTDPNGVPLTQTSALSGLPSRRRPVVPPKRTLRERMNSRGGYVATIGALALTILGVASAKTGFSGAEHSEHGSNTTRTASDTHDSRMSKTTTETPIMTAVQKAIDSGKGKYPWNRVVAVEKAAGLSQAQAEATATKVLTTEVSRINDNDDSAVTLRWIGDPRSDNKAKLVVVNKKTGKESTATTKVWEAVGAQMAHDAAQLEELAKKS